MFEQRKSACPYGPVIDRAAKEAVANPEALDDILAHLALGCPDCLARIPRSLRLFLSLAGAGMGNDSKEEEASCLLSAPELDRWFAHRPRLGLPAPWQEALALPPAVRLHHIVTAPDLLPTEVLSALGSALDSLVLTQPANSVEVAQAGVVFATAVGPLALAEPVAWDLQHRALRASAEMALRREDYRSACRYARWLARHWEHACDPYEIAETANTLALFEVWRGDLSDAASMLEEAAAVMVEADDVRLAGKMLTNAGIVSIFDGLYPRAATLAEAALLHFSQTEPEPTLIQHAEELLNLATGGDTSGHEHSGVVDGDTIH